MTCKELLYVEDSLEHEKFMKSCCIKTANQIQDINLANFLKDLSQKHNEIYNKFLKLL